jgi:hypothetical protein
MTMQTFKLRPNGFDEIKKKLLIRSIPPTIVTMIIGGTISYTNAKNTPTDAGYYITIIVIFLGVTVFSLWRGIRKQRALSESYTLSISDSLIVREQLNTPDISIQLSEVQEIVKYPKGGFSIKGSRNNGMIMIPVQIDNYSQLETTLQQIHPITTKSNSSVLQKFRFLLTIMSLGLMLCVFTVNNKIVVGIAGPLCTALIIWSLIRVQTDKNTDRKTKNRMWISLLVIASIIGVTIMKLTAPTLP